MIDYYNLLGIKFTSRPEEIRSAFRRKAKTAHPDAHPHLTGKGREEMHHRFIQLAKAYETLSDHDRRLAYDRKLRAARAAHAASSQAKAARGAKKPTGAPPRQGGQSHPGERPAQKESGKEEEYEDLLSDVEELLNKFGLDMRNQVERWFDKMLDWAMTVFMEVVQSIESAGKEQEGETGGTGGDSSGKENKREPSPGKTPGAKSRPHSAFESKQDLEEELEALKQQVHSEVEKAEGKRATMESVEEELARIKASTRKDR